MQFYFSPSDDPYYNLALEEYLLYHAQEDILLCYINRPALVVGRFQVPYREVDVKYMADNDMALVRRLSGGGSVYHDPGNLNYSYICKTSQQIDNEYDHFNAKTIEVLRSLGLTELSFERNNIFSHQKKISGVAQYKRVKKIVHHGTLLVNADLAALRRLFVTKDYYESKGVRSVSSSVANVSEFIDVDMATVIDAFKASTAGGYHLEVDDEELALKANEYASMEWYLGKSPKYDLSHQGVDLCIEGGRIVKSSHIEVLSQYHDFKTLASIVSSPEDYF